MDESQCESKCRDSCKEPLSNKEHAYLVMISAKEKGGAPNSVYDLHVTSEEERQGGEMGRRGWSLVYAELPLIGICKQEGPTPEILKGDPEGAQRLSTRLLQCWGSFLLPLVFLLFCISQFSTRM